ncbi:MAG: thermonuclease family protein [Pseudomonadota bacterium]
MIRAALILSAFLASPAAADTRAIDGDTTALGTEMTITIRNPRVRLLGIDTPEIGRAECPEERALALAARKALAEYIDQGAVMVRHETWGLDSLSRILGVYMLGHVSVNELLVERGFALVSDSQADWCPYLAGRLGPVTSLRPVKAPR